MHPGLCGCHGSGRPDGLRCFGHRDCYWGNQRCRAAGTTGHSPPWSWRTLLRKLSPPQPSLRQLPAIPSHGPQAQRAARASPTRECRLSQPRSHGPPRTLRGPWQPAVVAAVAAALRLHRPTRLGPEWRQLKLTSATTPIQRFKKSSLLARLLSRADREAAWLLHMWVRRTILRIRNPSPQ